MAYSDGGQIDAKDYNEVFAGVPVPLANIGKQFNAIWGVGKGNKGYGQPNVLPVVAPGDKISSLEWYYITNYINRVRNWQGSTGSSWPGDPAPSIASTASGQPVLYDQGNFQKMLDYIEKYRMCVYQRGSGIAPGITNTYTWTKTLTFTVKLIFSSGDKARYFFNCGGQIAMNFSYPTTSTERVPQILKQLAVDMGTVYWSCTAGSQKTIVGNVQYDRVTKIGGGGNDPEVKANVDYYDPSLYDATGNGVLLFKQKAKSSIPGYTDNISVSIFASTTGTKGLNEDNGTTVILKCLVDLGAGVTGYSMPANMGRFDVTATGPYTPLTGWSGSTGYLLYQQSWSLPSSLTSVIAI